MHTSNETEKLKAASAERERILKMIRNEMAYWQKATSEGEPHPDAVAIEIGATGALSNVIASILIGRDIRAEGPAKEGVVS